MTLPARNSIASITYAVPSGKVASGDTYNITYNFLNNDEFVNVWYRNANSEKVELTLDSDFKIDISSGTNNVYGVCVLLKDISDVTSITFERSIAISQDIDFNNSTLYPSITEYAFDKLTAILQDQDFKDYTIHAPSDETVTDPRKFELPPESERLGKIVGFNAQGKIEMYDVPDGGTSYNPATRDELGLVIIGDKLSLEPSGLINVPVASNSTLGVVKVGTGIDLNDGTISVDITGLREIAQTAKNNSETALTNATSAKNSSEEAKALAEKTADLLDWYVDGAWTDTTLPASGVTSSTYANGRFIISHANSVKSSSGYPNSMSSMTWSDCILPLTKNWSDVASTNHNGTLVVMVSTDGSIIYSTGNDIWLEARVTGGTGSWKFVMNKGDTFVAIGTNNFAITENRSRSWTVYNAPWGTTPACVVATEQNFFVVDSDGSTLYKSATGSSWEIKPYYVPAGGIQTICYGNGLIVGLTGHQSGNVAYYIANEWQGVGTVSLPETVAPANTVWSSVKFGGNRFVGIASNSDRVIYSQPSGNQWQKSNYSLPSSSGWVKLDYGKDRFLALNSDSTRAEFKVSIDIVNVLEGMLS